MWLIVLVFGSNPVQNNVAPAPLPGASGCPVARTSSTPTAPAGMLVRGSGSHEAGGVELSILNHGMPGDIRGRSGGRTGRCLGRCRAGKPNELPGGVEFLILRAHAFELHLEQSS